LIKWELKNKDKKRLKKEWQGLAGIKKSITFASALGKKETVSSLKQVFLIRLRIGKH
jgi:hypothetical protein